MKCCGKEMKEVRYYNSLTGGRPPLRPSLYVCEVCGFVKGKGQNLGPPEPPGIPNFDRCFSNEETKLPTSIKDIPNINEPKLANLSHLKDDLMEEINRMKKLMGDNNEK